MGILSGNPRENPMHYGEVVAVWGGYLGAKSALVTYQGYLNHAGDRDLAKFIEDMIRHVLESEIEETESLLKANSVEIPPTPPERSKANSEDIPTGARAKDPEIAAALSKDIAQSLVAASQAIGQCVREDIAMMFGQFHTKRAQMGSKLLQMNKDKGWLIHPPLHVDQVK
ncbi:MAG TPA: DUF3231 family protein [Bacillales bacterium]|nr:DUF3231 family protein [Bacillales bacterium]